MPARRRSAAISSKGIETDAAARTITLHLTTPDPDLLHKLALSRSRTSCRPDHPSVPRLHVPRAPARIASRASTCSEARARLVRNPLLPPVVAGRAAGRPVRPDRGAAWTTDVDAEVDRPVQRGAADFDARSRRVRSAGPVPPAQLPAITAESAGRMPHRRHPRARLHVPERPDAARSTTCACARRSTTRRTEPGIVELGGRRRRSRSRPARCSSADSRATSRPAATPRDPGSGRRLDGARHGAGAPARGPVRDQGDEDRQSGATGSKDSASPDTSSRCCDGWARASPHFVEDLLRRVRPRESSTRGKHPQIGIDWMVAPTSRPVRDPPSTCSVCIPEATARTSATAGFSAQYRRGRSRRAAPEAKRPLAAASTTASARRGPDRAHVQPPDLSLVSKRVGNQQNHPLVGPAATTRCGCR